MATGDSTGGQIASAAISTLGNYAVQAASNKRQFKFQKEAMALQDTYNRNLWDYQNAYNTPQAQMERLKAAGLNPYLIYGNGSSNSGNAGPIQPLEVPTEKAATAQVPDFGQRYLQTRMLDQQYAATTQNIENAKKRGALMEVQTSLENLKLMRESMRSKNYGALNQAEKRTQQFIAARMEELYNNEGIKGQVLAQLGDQRSKRFPQEMTSLQLDNDFKRNRNALANLGIYQSDHPMFRVLIAASHRMGIPLDELLKEQPGKLAYLFN